MICNELYSDQGLGNQLWNYAVARIIAKRNGYDFSILKKDRFKGKEFMDIDFGIPLTGGHTSKRGYVFSLPKGITSYYSEKRELMGDTLSDMSNDISRTDPHLLNLSPNTKFQGNCQSTRYLDGYRGDILSWIQIKDEYSQYRPAANVCIIHLRCGDFMQSKAFLPMKYYTDAMAYIASIDPSVVFQCVTDQKDVAEQLLPGVAVVGSALSEATDSTKASHHHGGPIGIDFCLIKNARYAIIPNSSFSWWAAYLNTDRKIIIAPKYWARFNIADGFWSPSDIITDGFTYMDKEGRVFSPEACWHEKDSFEKEHESLFNSNHAINKPWKRHSLFITPYILFFIKKMPTLKGRILKMLRR